jgi:hypothetical protein
MSWLPNNVEWKEKERKGWVRSSFDERENILLEIDPFIFLLRKYLKGLS